MARLRYGPWLKEPQGFEYDDNGNPIIPDPATSIAGPSEPFDSGDIAGKTQEMFNNIMMQNAMNQSAGETDVNPGANIAQSFFPQAQPQAPESQAPQATPNWYQSQQVQAPVPQAPIPQAPVPQPTEPQAQIQPMQSAAQTPEPQQQQQGGNFLGDLAYSAIGNMYTPWERTSTGQWEPNRQAGMGSRIGTAIGQLLRAAPGLQYSNGSFRYDPYAGSYLNRQKNEMLMRTGQMNDQYDPSMQAIMGQAAGSRAAAYRQAAGIPMPLTREEQLQNEIAERRALDALDRELNPEKYWTPEQKQQFELDTLGRELQLRNQFRSTEPDPYNTVIDTLEQAWGAQLNPQQRAELRAQMMTQKTMEELNGMKPGNWYGGNGVAPGIQSEAYPAFAEDVNVGVYGLTPEFNRAGQEAESTNALKERYGSQDIPQYMWDKQGDQAVKNILGRSMWNPWYNQTIPRTEEEKAAVSEFNRLTGRKPPVGTKPPVNFYYSSGI